MTTINLEEQLNKQKFEMKYKANCFYLVYNNDIEMNCKTNIF